MYLPRETRAFLRLLAGMAMADWLVRICQHPPQPPCEAASPPRSCPTPLSRLPFRAEPPAVSRPAGVWQGAVLALSTLVSIGRPGAGTSAGGWSAGLTPAGRTPDTRGLNSRGPVCQAECQERRRAALLRLPLEARQCT
jgi:hypothetical protein